MATQEEGQLAKKVPYVGKPTDYRNHATVRNNMSLYERHVFAQRRTLNNLIVELFILLDERRNGMVVSAVQTSDPIHREKLIYLLSAIRQKAGIVT
jgi:hypothetical protein